MSPVIAALCSALLILQAGQTDIQDLAHEIALRLERTGALGIVQIHFSGAGDERRLGFFPAVEPDPGAQYTVLRRVVSAEPGQLRYVRAGAVDGGDLASREPGAAQSLSDGDLLLRCAVPIKLALSVRSDPASLLPEGFAEQLENVLAGYLEATGLYRIERLCDFYPVPDSFRLAASTALRNVIADIGAAGALSAWVTLAGEQLVVVCRFSAIESEDDFLFSARRELPLELAAALGEHTQSRQTMAGDGNVLFSAPLPAHVLDLEAADLDGAPGDELVVLTPDQLLIYRVDGTRLSLGGRYSLSALEPAPFNARLPAGRLTVADVRASGRPQILIAGNVWAGGAIVDIDSSLRAQVTAMSYQPVAAASVDGSPAIFAGRYRPGEDGFEGTLTIYNPQATGTIRIGSMRKIEPLDASGSVAAVLDAEGRLSILRSADGNVRAEPVLLPELVKTFHCARWRPGLAALAVAQGPDPGEGDSVILANILSPSSGRAAILTELDIAAIAVCSLQHNSDRAVVVCGRDWRGVTRVFFYSWPRTRGTEYPERGSADSAR